MISTKAVIKTEAIYSDDETHRYVLRKEWNKTLPTATIISISPSSYANVSADLTTQLITNNLDQLGFGSFELVNLYSKIDEDAKKAKSIHDLYNEETDTLIKTSCDKTFKSGDKGSIILAWGKLTENNKKHAKREKTILSLLSVYFDKVYCIADETGRHFLHPLTPSIRHSWYLESWKDYRKYKVAEQKAINAREQAKLKKEA